MPKQIKMTDKADAQNTLTTNEDPRCTPDVYCWFYRNGRVFNHCTVPSKWVLDNYLFHN